MHSRDIESAARELLQKFSAMRPGSIASFIANNPGDVRAINEWVETQDKKNLSNPVYACYALVTDDIQKLDPEKLKATADYFDGTLNQAIVESLNSMKDFVNDPKDYMQKLLTEAQEKNEYSFDVNGRYRNLSGVDLSSLNPKKDFIGYHFNGFNLTGVNLSGANLSTADLRNTCLTGAKLEDVVMKDTKLEGSNINNASVRPLEVQDQKVARKKGSWPGLFRPQTAEQQQEKNRRKTSLQTKPEDQIGEEKKQNFLAKLINRNK